MNKIQVKSNGKSFSVYIRDDADESVAAEIFDKHEYRIADDIIKSATDPIIDIGSHAGFFSLYVRTLNENVPILAIEPEPNNIDQLSRHLKENNIKSIKVVAGAVAADAGRRHLVVSKDSHNHYLLNREDVKTQNSTIVNTWSLPELLKKSIIDNVSLVKMDIEGGEYEVFEGLKIEDLAKIKAFIIEYHLDGGKKYQVIENNLRVNGFGVQIMPSKFDKKMGFIFAVNKRK
ncbi:MAG: FkbM family methyltransferase [Patescibacteria group bacterium]|jgi:FkbM family methyltransferase